MGDQTLPLQHFVPILELRQGYGRHDGTHTGKLQASPYPYTYSVRQGHILEVLKTMSDCRTDPTNCRTESITGRMLR